MHKLNGSSLETLISIVNQRVTMKIILYQVENKMGKEKPLNYIKLTRPDISFPIYIVCKSVP